MGIGYSSSKLHVAIEALLTSAKPLQDRLAAGILVTVTSNPSFVTSMPDAAREKYEHVLARLSKPLPADRQPNRGSIQDNAAQLNDTEAIELTEAFWACYRLVMQAEAAELAQQAAAEALANMPEALRQVADAIQTEATRDRTTDFDAL